MKWLITGGAGWVLGAVGLAVLGGAELADAIWGMVFEGRGLDGRKPDGRY